MGNKQNRRAFLGNLWMGATVILRWYRDRKDFTNEVVKLGSEFPIRRSMALDKPGAVTCDVSARVAGYIHDMSPRRKIVEKPKDDGAGHLGREGKYYSDMMKKGGPLWNYGFDTNENARVETCYFRNMLLRDVRAIKYMMSRSEWDGKKIMFHGSSQGGYQAAAIAGLVPETTSFDFYCAWAIDLGGSQCHWRPKWGEGVQYCDPVNMAHRVNGKNKKMVISHGVVDSACPVDGIFAWINEMPTDVDLTLMRLASRQTTLSAAAASMPVLEVRRLTQTGHQTAIITTAQRLQSPQAAGRMFSRWCQENFFGYMTRCAELLDDIQRLKADLADLKGKRRETKKRVTIAELPESERPTQLRPLAKMFTDTVKMIAYRAETTLVGLLSPRLAKEDEARALIRELFVSSADIMPDDKANTLTVRIQRMACPAHDKAMAALLADLTAAAFRHPETGMTMIYELT